MVDEPAPGKVEGPFRLPGTCEECSSAPGVPHAPNCPHYEDPALAGYRAIAEAQEARLIAVENLFLQVALDLVTFATALESVQQNTLYVCHDALASDLRHIHGKWMGLLREAEQMGRIQLQRASKIIVPGNSEKMN